MCGIHATISAHPGVDLSASLRQALVNRGPDHLSQVTRIVPSKAQGSDIFLTFTSTVLALRGDHVAKQPLEDLDNGSVFCWNGEAWKIDGRPIDGNDGEAIFARLMSNPVAIFGQRKSHVLEVLRCIQGPFAFVYYDAPGKCLYFGRDRLGRRSLLINRPGTADAIAFSSLADSSTTDWKEVTADGIYSISLDTEKIDDLVAERDEWIASGGTDLVSSIGSFNMTTPEQEKKLDFATSSVGSIRDHLTEALKLRVLNVPRPPAITGHDSEVDVRVAVLFSGGLDCTLMARLTHEVLPSLQGIDLINVAFQNARNVASQQDGLDNTASIVYEACPDRITGRKAFAELQAACPSRQWRFIAVNVPFSEAMSHRSQVVSLMYPHNTEMDLSIALALYFASRGVGLGYTDPTANLNSTDPIVTTPARVLLSGLGADELFGGYSRHEVAFKRSGYPGLIDELKLDVSRIGERNLGRDDRILSSWGKEVRFPFLDEDFIKFSIGCPVWEKCDFANQSHLADIDPAKRVLRLLADQLDLPSTAREKKRAIQFGARTAKIEQRAGGPKTKGTDIIS
ncbi:asparagine synthase related protein [Seiridium cupressi]